MATTSISKTIRLAPSLIRLVSIQSRQGILQRCQCSARTALLQNIHTSVIKEPTCGHLLFARAHHFLRVLHPHMQPVVSDLDLGFNISCDVPLEHVMSNVVTHMMKGHLHVVPRAVRLRYRRLVISFPQSIRLRLRQLAAILLGEGLKTSVEFEVMPHLSRTRRRSKLKTQGAELGRTRVSTIHVQNGASKAVEVGKGWKEGRRKIVERGRGDGSRKAVGREVDRIVRRLVSSWLEKRFGAWLMLLRFMQTAGTRSLVNR